MAKQIAGVYERVLECAKVEFLEKGFKEASLRTIAKNANTSTGSIYTRFEDKGSLFTDLVSPVIEGLKIWFWKEQEEFHQCTDSAKKANSFEYSKDKINDFVDYIYDNFDVFKLLITCSEGTAFSDFVHDIVEIDVEYTIKFIESTGNDAFTSGRANTELLHILSSSFYSGVFETVIHDMSREHAHIYVMYLQQIFQYGWANILKF